MVYWYCPDCGDGPWESEVVPKCTSCGVGTFSLSISGFASHSPTPQYSCRISHDYSHATGVHGPIRTDSPNYSEGPLADGDYRWQCCECGGDNNYALTTRCTNGYCGHEVSTCCHVYEVTPKKGWQSGQEEEEQDG
ncbi:hypothetical protein CC86DRAFT_158469 [Ophiobolus disseminans]|uniref:Uncharacterized protein n=1 Tax=Ophiobolus disseminans TaxID=1469910 RepID=A0A6A6ZDK1_9PLEO|nr:hypothetical protein CC86DRAFT_158469 [Ophiobolus disseminans]